MSSPAGTAEFSPSPAGVLISRDSLTGVVTEHGPSPEPCVVWMGDLERGFGVAQPFDALRAWIGPLGGPLDIEVEFEEPVVFLPESFGLNDRIPMLAFGETASALLLAITFGAFAAGGTTFIKLFGLGLAVAVVADAFFVRVTLLPAVMKLLGDRAWWAPGRSTRAQRTVVEAEGTELYA